MLHSNILHRKYHLTKDLILIFSFFCLYSYLFFVHFTAKTKLNETSSSDESDSDDTSEGQSIKCKSDSESKVMSDEFDSENDSEIDVDRKSNPKYSKKPVEDDLTIKYKSKSSKNAAKNRASASGKHQKKGTILHI